MLTHEEKRKVFDRLKNFISDNYVVKQVQKARTRAEAIKAAKNALNYSGFAGPNMPTVMCRGGKGIFIKMPDDREAHYNWGEFVDYILNKQMCLFK